MRGKESSGECFGERKEGEEGRVESRGSEPGVPGVARGLPERSSRCGVGAEG